VKQTAFEAMLGFFFGTSLGIGIAIGFVYSRNVARTVYPYAVLLRSLPLLALMPLLVSWFGPGLTSKTVLISLATFFPTLVNMVQGLNSIDRNALELMDTYNAPEKAVFWKVRLPFSLPYLFTSIKITLPAAVLAAIISEWLWASKGLGAYIVNTMFNAQVNNLWAAMTIATALSILTYVTAAVLEMVLIPWHASVNDRQVGES
jgi:NitT/TauT family transport system permease protein